MDTERFADRIGEIVISGTMVRIDLMSYSVTERDARNQPTLEFRQRIVMPVEGFVHSYGLMTEAMQRLEKKGLFRRKGPEAKVSPVPEATGAQPSSPNFKPKSA